MTGMNFLLALPPDPESHERAEAFRGLLADSRRSETALSLARDVYRAAADTRLWMSLHDLNMFVYSLEENPSLVPELVGTLGILMTNLPESTRRQYQAVLEATRGRFASAH